jgi:hypothetical protein
MTEEVSWRLVEFERRISPDRHLSARIGAYRNAFRLKRGRENSLRQFALRFIFYGT